MSEKLPTAVEFLELFRPRFEKITLVPTAWGQFRRDDPRAHQRLYFGFRRDGELLDNVQGVMPFLDVAEAKLPVSLTYDASSAMTIHQQLFMRVAKAAEELFQDRVFRLKPLRPIETLESHSRWMEIPLQIELDGEPIPGLHLDPRAELGFELKGDWMTFIKRHTLEDEVIWARIRYERALRIEPRDIKAERDKAEEKLRDALARVPS